MSESRTPRSRFLRSLERLREEVFSEEEVMDLLDNLEILAGHLAEYKIPGSRRLQNKPLAAVLKAIGKKEKDEQLVEWAAYVGEAMDSLRQSDYDDDDADALVEQANELREWVLKKIGGRFA